MSNGKINYELGLESSGFLSKIVGANQAVQLFQQGLSLVSSIGSRAFEQIHKGGALQDQSNRTRESVKDLFQLGHAFEMSGVAAGSVPTTLQRFRQSLSGVGEMGENTAEAFKLLGLNITDLGKMNAPEALQAIDIALETSDETKYSIAYGEIFTDPHSGKALQLLNLRRQGVSHYAVYPPTYRRTSFTWDPPKSISGGGIIETPVTVNLTLPTGYTWLRQADRVSHNGTYFTRESVWSGGKGTLAFLYGS